MMKHLTYLLVLAAALTLPGYLLADEAAPAPAADAAQTEATEAGDAPVAAPAKKPAEAEPDCS